MRKRTDRALIKERNASLKCKLAYCQTVQKSLEAKQLAGDRSEDTARELNLITNKIIVIKNRLNGSFTKPYPASQEITIPKPGMK